LGSGTGRRACNGATGDGTARRMTRSITPGALEHLSFDQVETGADNRRRLVSVDTLAVLRASALRSAW
jgi:hypothetical protein